MPDPKNYPKYFSIYTSPNFYESEPNLKLEQRELIEKYQISNYDILPRFKNDNHTHVFESDDNYNYFICEYKIKTIDNPYYLKELQEYNKRKRKYKEELTEWKKLKKQWLEEDREEKIQREKILLKKLKEKYEGKI